MDPELACAILSANIDSRKARTWFDVVDASYSEAADDWEEFTEKLNVNAGSEFSTAAESFVEYAEQHGKLDLVKKLVENLSSLPDEYATARAAIAGTTTAQATVSAVTSDPSAEIWRGIVMEFGSGLAGWDGSDGTWPQFRDWLYSAANSKGYDWYAAAYQKIGPLDGVSRTDRIQQLRALGLTINAPGTPAPATTATASTDRFGWLTAEQGKRLSDNWGDDWQRFLGEQLDYWWGSGWEATYGNEGGRSYLDELIKEWLSEGSASAAGPQATGDTEKMIEEMLAQALKTIPGADQLDDRDLEDIRAELRSEISAAGQKGSER